VVPELLQSEVNGARIAAEVRSLLEPAKYAAVQRELFHVRKSLGEAGASKRVAHEIFRMVKGETA
jgi:lipid A disaccharide synthetase